MTQARTNSTWRLQWQTIQHRMQIAQNGSAQSYTMDASLCFLQRALLYLTYDCKLFCENKGQYLCRYGLDLYLKHNFALDCSPPRHSLTYSCNKRWLDFKSTSLDESDQLWIVSRRSPVTVQNEWETALKICLEQVFFDLLCIEPHPNTAAKTSLTWVLLAVSFTNKYRRTEVSSTNDNGVRVKHFSVKGSDAEHKL